MNAQENRTLAAFRCALAYGADIIETDLYLTSDGVFVCFHDGGVDRTDRRGTAQSQR
jgi:glycerophosphoryl diester phosphodiesterase